MALLDQHDVDLALVDCPLGKEEGTVPIQRIHEASPSTEIVALTEMGANESTFHVMRSGACDYYEKPISDWHRFFQVINKALEVHKLKAEKTRLAKLRSGEAIEQVIGDNPAMRDLGALTTAGITTPVPVLIIGESGVGRRVARAIHAASSRKHGPWVAINCATIPADLLESEALRFREGVTLETSPAKEGTVRDGE